MKLSFLNVPTLLALGAAFTLAACSTPSRAPISEESSQQAEIHRASAAIETAAAKQYDRLAPEHFQRAVDYRNSAKEKLSKGAASEKVLNDTSISLQAASEVQAIGDANVNTMRSVLAARQFAMNAQAPQFQEKQFRSADKDLGKIGEQIENGKYRLDAKELTEIEKKFSRAEIFSRKRVELGSVRAQIEKAKQDGAKKKTPLVLEKAMAKVSVAEQAIEMSPHNPENYTASIMDARKAAQKLTDVLAIANGNGGSEEVALTIWNQNQALVASREALSKAKSDAESNEAQLKAQAETELSRAQAKAAAEQSQLESTIADKDARLDRQHDSIAALRSENQVYANEEELKQKIDEIKKTFSSDEAEVMKDGKNLVVRLKKMQFPSGRAELNPDSFATLRKVDNLIAAVPVTQVTVEGHTDSIGSESMNKELSEKRAEAVKKYLLSQGLSEQLQVDTAGFGSNRPITSNKTKGGRAMNRRVDIVIQTPATL